ncbi:MAG TPA: aminotransferase class I/II-fold pyridoxal phosphate-dependent enzyme [Acidimicrobiales bacterium]|nr:aminotransferase class I/II-fold pyridoxal phosphate-dependent enzyme [Acidimicrobiales bacterium]
MSWARWAEGETAAIRAAGQWRTVRALDGPEPETVIHDGGDGPHRQVVSFASNDYLGLTRHPAVVAAAHEALERWGTGSGAARLVSGSRSVHGELEAELAAWKEAERAVLFPTGYAANLGVLATLAGPGMRILSDELNHASIVDGCRLARSSGAEVVVYPHGDVDRVASLLAQGAPAHTRTLVVTDSVFSMDGDTAGLDELTDLCGRHGALLVIDEAHAVLGPEPPLGRCEILRVGTLSKTLASLGGFVAGTTPLVELLVNRARPFIFTTASPPAVAAAALASLRVVRSGEGESLRRRLRRHVDQLSPGHPSPIVAFVLGEEAAALYASAQLLEQGLLVPAIRPPTVAPGTSRLRVALSAAHSDNQVERLREALSVLLPIQLAPPPTRCLVKQHLPAPLLSNDGLEPAPGEPAMARPDCLVLVTGTGTDVGKTWVTAALASAWRAGGATVAARKPALSFDPGESANAGSGGPGGGHTTDAEVLAAATGEDPRNVCPEHRRYAVAMAPPLAASALCRPAFTVAELVGELRWPAGAAIRYGLVEGVGGPRSPLAADGDTVTLIELLKPDHVVLVASAGLGAINAVLLSAAAIGARQPTILLNRFDAGNRTHAGNARWLREHTGLTVTTSVAALAVLL